MRPKIQKPQKAPILPAKPGAVLSSLLPQHEWLIGRSVVVWSFLENQMSELIWGLLGLEIERGRIITGRMDASSKISKLRELGKVVLNCATYEFMTETLDHIDIQREDRNAVVHGTWALDDQMTPIVLSLKQKALAPDEVVSEAFPESRMLLLIENIGISGTRLSKLKKELAEAGTPAGV
jgi:hypothetical protein